MPSRHCIASPPLSLSDVLTSMMEQPEDCAPAQPTPTPPPPPQSKRPSQALYVPKQRLPGSKDKAQTQGEVKPRPRPRYTDKARKNAKNKKDKAGAADKGAPVAGEELPDADCKPDVKEEWLQGTDVQVNGHSDSPDGVADAATRLEATSLQEEPGEEESWDTLFNDEGDFLDPHVVEEVRARCRSG